MKITMILSIFLLSCTYSSFNANRFNGEAPIVLNGDSYFDIIEKFGEPNNEYLFRNHLGSAVILKYKDLMDYGDIYIKLEFVYDEFTVITSSTTTLFDNRSPGVWVEYQAIQNFYDRSDMRISSKKSEMYRRVNSEKLFERFPHLWVVTAYDFRPY